MAAPPLAGYRVPELGNVIAAPFGSRIFAGAEVVKVDRPGAGNELRGRRRGRGDTSMLFRTMPSAARCSWRWVKGGHRR